MNYPSEPKPTDGKRILLIEDDCVNRQLLCEYLAYCNYHVFSIGLGSQFFEAIASFQPALILLDLRLPDICGFTLLEQLYHDKRYRNIPTVVTSALAFKVDQERALSLGVSHYLVKPFDLLQLQHLLQKLIPSASRGNCFPKKRCPIASLPKNHAKGSKFRSALLAV